MSPKKINWKSPLISILVLCFLLGTEHPSAAQTESKKLLQIVDPEAYPWKSIGNSPDIRFLKIDETLYPKNPKQIDLHELTELVNRTTNLSSVWIPGRFLSDKLLGALTSRANLRTIVIFDPIGTAKLIRSLEKSSSLDLVVLVRYRTSFESPVGRGRMKIDEVDLFENSPYLNSNGCPTSDFLKKHFGFEFSKQEPNQEPKTKK